MIKSTNVIDNGLTHSQPARYEQHFGDGTVVYSDTMPDRNAFRIESKIATQFSIGDVVDVIAAYAIPEDLANNPWKVYGISIELGNIFYKIESVGGNDCATFKEGALKIHG
jgi:hypothetical protein